MFSLQGKDDSKLAVNWFQLLMVPVYEGKFTNNCSSFSGHNFPNMIAPTQIARFEKRISYHFPNPFALCLEKGEYSGYQSSLCQSFPKRIIYIICKFSRSHLQPI